MGSEQHRQDVRGRRSATSRRKRNEGHEAPLPESEGGWPELAPVEHRETLRRSWAVLEEEGRMPRVAGELYRLLLQRDPVARHMFADSADLHIQQHLFPQVLHALLDNEQAVRNLAHYHTHMGIAPHQASTFCRSLLDAVSDAVDGDRTVLEAWDAVVGALEDVFVGELTKARPPVLSSPPAPAVPVNHSGYLSEVRVTRRPGAGYIPPPVAGWAAVKSSRSPPQSNAPPPAASLWKQRHRERNHPDMRHPRTCMHRTWKEEEQERSHHPPPQEEDEEEEEEGDGSPESLDKVDKEHWVVTRRRRWLQLRGQYLFFYPADRREKPCCVVDISRVEVCDEPQIGFGFFLKAATHGACSSKDDHRFLLSAEGDNDKEQWMIRLKRAAHRFSFARPFRIGQRVALDDRHGTCQWFGSTEGTSLAWKAPGLWVGIQLDHPVEGGHDGTFRGKRYFECPPGHGIVVPAFGVRLLLPQSEEGQGGTLYRPESFDLLTVLGEGSFGCVCKVREKATGLIYACKILQKEALLQENQLGNLHRETNILFQVTHPYIVKLRAAFHSEEHVLLLFDFLSGGELWFHMSEASRMSAPFSCFEEERARFYFAEVALAMGYLHSLNIVHRDLKLENLVLDADGHVVLTDFGFAKSVDPSAASLPISTAQCGTLPYMAPEMLRKQGYGKEVDWWSLGVVLFVMLTGCYPYWVSLEDGSLDTEGTAQQIREGRVIEPGEFPDGVDLSGEAVDLICRLLAKDPSSRLSHIDAVVAHPWFGDFDWKACGRRELSPPFVPDPRGRNTKYFHKASKAAAGRAKSLMEPKNGCTKDGGAFTHFTTVMHPSLSALSDDWALENLPYFTSA